MQSLYEKIESLSNEEFEELIQFISKARKKRVKAIFSEAQKRAARLMQDTESGNNKNSSTLAKPAKYRDPLNSRNTWSGYGRQPDWMKKHLNSGGKKEDCLI